MIKDFDTNSWNTIKRILQKEYPKLTKADFFWRDGTKEDVLKMIADKLGISRKDIEELIVKSQGSLQDLI